MSKVISGWTVKLPGLINVRHDREEMRRLDLVGSLRTWNASVPGPKSQLPESWINLEDVGSRNYVAGVTKPTDPGWSGSKRRRIETRSSLVNPINIIMGWMVLIERPSLWNAYGSVAECQASVSASASASASRARPFSASVSLTRSRRIVYERFEISSTLHNSQDYRAMVSAVYFLQPVSANLAR